MKEFLVVIVALSVCMMLFATPPSSGLPAARTSDTLARYWVNPDGARGAPNGAPRGESARAIAMWTNPGGEKGSLDSTTP